MTVRAGEFVFSVVISINSVTDRRGFKSEPLFEREHLLQRKRAALRDFRLREFVEPEKVLRVL